MNFWFKDRSRMIQVSNIAQIRNAALANSLQTAVILLISLRLILDAASFFSCFACGAKTCVSCSVAFHSGYTCSQYKESLVENKASEARSKVWLDKNAKLCICGKWVQKTDGCDHMRCRCGAEWCYACGVSYTLISRMGNVAHRQTCIHHRPVM